VKSTEAAPAAEWQVRLPRREVEELREAFDLLDTDGSGVIDPKELILAFESLKLDNPNQAVLAVVHQLDTPENASGIDFEKFLEAITVR